MKNLNVDFLNTIIGGNAEFTSEIIEGLEGLEELKELKGLKELVPAHSKSPALNSQELPVAEELVPAI